MSKDRISVSIDKDLSNLLDREELNKSGTVNKLLRKYFDGGDDTEELLKFRIDQVEGEIEELENSLETKRGQLKRLKERRDGFQEEREQTIKEAIETLGDGDWTPKDPKIQYWAKQADIDETDLIERIEDHYSNTSRTSK